MNIWTTKIRKNMCFLRCILVNRHIIQLPVNNLITNKCALNDRY